MSTLVAPSPRFLQRISTRTRSTGAAVLVYYSIDKQRYDLLDERLPLPKDEADFVMRMFSVLLPVVGVENLRIMCSCEIDLTKGTPPEVEGATLVLIGSSKYNKITKHVFDHWRTKAETKPNLWFEPMESAGQFMVREQRPIGHMDHEPTYPARAMHQAAKRGIMKDYGIIAKCPSPFHPRLSAFVFGGCRMASQIAIERILFDLADENGNFHSWHEAARESKMLLHVLVDVEYQYIPQGKPLLVSNSLKVTPVRI